MYWDQDKECISKDDLEQLTKYDINKMLEELSISVTNLNDSVKVLTIEDESGDKYLKDTTIIYSSKSFQVEPENYDNEISYDDDFDDYKKKKYRYMPRSKFFFNIDIGLNNYLENGKTPDGGALHRLSPGASWYWGLDPTMRSHIAGAFFIEWGVGLDFNVYRYQDNRTRIVADDTGVMFYKDTREISAKKSKLSTMYLQGKIVPMFALGSNKHRGHRLWNNIDKGFRIGAGVYGGYRLWSRTKVKYTENGSKRKDRSTSNYYINDLRYGIRGQIGIGGFDVFFMYDLNKMFQENSGGPVLSRYQFGITL